jgi:hypothetical protein
MIEVITRDADGISREVRIGVDGLDLTRTEKRLLREARFPSFLWRAMSFGSIALFTGFALALVATSWQLEWIARLAGIFAMLGLIALACGATWFVMRSIDYKLGDLIAGAWLGLGRCPACGFHVAACEQDEDGVVKCPECSASWRLRVDGVKM